MRKLLSVIIPRHKETEKEMFPLLASISTQVGIDFSDMEVIISNDGGGTGELDNSFLGLFGMKIRQVSLVENRGPGVTRQAGLDAAQGEYVLFCDADDILHNAGVLGALMQEAEKAAPDMLCSSWLEEIVDGTGRRRYITHENENTWMHGKLLRRHFLTQNNIRFHDSLRVHEDSYFLCIAASMTQRRVNLPITSYIWKYHPGSITRRDGAAYSYNSIPEFIRACAMAHAEVEKRAPEQMEYKVLQFTLYNYFCFHQAGWQLPEHKKHLEAAEQAFAEYMKPMWHYWKNAPQEAIAGVYNEERAKNFTGGIESETIWGWIRRLGLDGIAGGQNTGKEEPDGETRPAF